MKKNEERGGTPIYRNRQWRMKERKKEKIQKREKWYKKDGNETVVSIPATPKSELKSMRKSLKIKRSKIKMKVIERRGQTLQSVLQKSRPTVQRKCREECPIICQNFGCGRRTPYRYRKRMFKS